MGDPFLNYFALFLLLFVVVVLFYSIIAIHDIPYMIAEARHHPHQDAIYAAGWVSLFTLHALWPLLWIWAMAYRPDRGWGFDKSRGQAAALPEVSHADLEELRYRLDQLERALEQQKGKEKAKVLELE
jgi:hypothetical protein